MLISTTWMNVINFMEINSIFNFYFIQGGHLVEVTTKKEDDTLKQLVPVPVWVGAQKTKRGIVWSSSKTTITWKQHG